MNQYGLKNQNQTILIVSSILIYGQGWVQALTLVLEAQAQAL